MLVLILLILLQIHGVSNNDTSTNSNDTGVCDKNTPPDKNTGWNISFESTASGAGLQSLLLGRMANAQVKGVVIFPDTSTLVPYPISRIMHHTISFIRYFNERVSNNNHLISKLPTIVTSRASCQSPTRDHIC